jgi:hypothetical protein
MVYPVRARPPGPGAQGPLRKGLAIFAPYSRVPAAEPLQEQRAVIYRATVKCDIRKPSIRCTLQAEAERLVTLAKESSGTRCPGANYLNAPEH